MRLLVSMLAGVLIVTCGGQAAPSSIEAETSTTTVAPTVATTAAIDMTSVTTAAPSTTAAPVSLDFLDFAVPFTLKEQPGWSVSDQIGDWALGLTASPTRKLAVSTAGPATIDLWIEKVTSSQFVEYVDLGESTIGGLPARVLDLRLLPGAPDTLCRTPCFELFAAAPNPDENFGWALFEDLPNRAWFVEVNGETVALFAEAREGEFDAWVAEVDQVLAELEWTG
jgi:hypothetical protein